METIAMWMLIGAVALLFAACPQRGPYMDRDGYHGHMGNGYPPSGYPLHGDPMRGN